MLGTKERRVCSREGGAATNVPYYKLQVIENGCAEAKFGLNLTKLKTNHLAVLT